MYRLIFFLRKIPQTGGKAPTLHSHSFLPHSIPQPPAWAAGKSILTRDAPVSSLKGKAPFGFFSSNHNTKKVRLRRQTRVGKKKKSSSSSATLEHILKHFSVSSRFFLASNSSSTPSSSTLSTQPASHRDFLQRQEMKRNGKSGRMC